MQRIKSLHFIDKEDDRSFQKHFGLSKEDLLDALAGIDTTIQWLKTSIYRNVLSDVTFFITDEPINIPGELAVEDHHRFKPVIYLNLMAIAEDYKNREYKLDMKQTDVSCTSYAAFVCLHEVGHYVHGLIGGNGKNKRERLFDYLYRGDYYYQRFLATMTHGDSSQEKKKYRNIPHEKAADEFARQCVALMRTEGYIS
ncbi:hypothetical protein [Desertibacillus haloalkaliphilus]|uniref:hypothetical protein n=1 Tax=Desertibacillus haloalkaliphilus TaxID=1328930 RepID=UPI001C263E41|nr:hypothetical protein [Desertibacillus haloalkaliphilus]MBU8907584.1 hypothetical protein [Desertibacillus haloalkaliphilus]